MSADSYERQKLAGKNPVWTPMTRASRTTPWSGPALAGLALAAYANQAMRALSSTVCFVSKSSGCLPHAAAIGSIGGAAQAAALSTYLGLSDSQRHSAMLKGVSTGAAQAVADGATAMVLGKTFTGFAWQAFSGFVAATANFSTFLIPIYVNPELLPGGTCPTGCMA